MQGCLQREIGRDHEIEVNMRLMGSKMSKAQGGGEA